MNVFVTICISTAKTFVTVFHDKYDNGVHYIDNEVWVDSNSISLHFYGETIKACACFKYLGVTLDEFGSPVAHLHNRLAALH